MLEKGTLNKKQFLKKKKRERAEIKKGCNF
jgi:hypothetical protein